MPPAPGAEDIAPAGGHDDATSLWRAHGGVAGGSAAGAGRVPPPGRSPASGRARPTSDARRWLRGLSARPLRRGRAGGARRRCRAHGIDQRGRAGRELFRPAGGGGEWSEGGCNAVRGRERRWPTGRPHGRVRAHHHDGNAVVPWPTVLTLTYTPIRSRPSTSHAWNSQFGLGECVTSTACEPARDTSSACRAVSPRRRKQSSDGHCSEEPAKVSAKSSDSAKILPRASSGGL
ncbi:hypothetical protein T492DRAFT_842667 [Pavlovales sp. CCMP2436]|nr:hypothetical protein T492DRAFT_842667 [Pavlovales sp. CCMP2436]